MPHRASVIQYTTGPHHPTPSPEEGWETTLEPPEAASEREQNSLRSHQGTPHSNADPPYANSHQRPAPKRRPSPIPYQTQPPPRTKRISTAGPALPNATDALTRQISTVAQAAESVAAAAEENAASVEEVSATAQELTAQVQEVSASAQQIADLAGSLRDAAAHFQLADTHSHDRPTPLRSPLRWQKDTEAPSLASANPHLPLAVTISLPDLRPSRHAC